MKELRLTFTDSEFRRLKRAKQDYNEKHNCSISWRLLIIRKCCASAKLTKNGGLEFTRVMFL